MAEPKKNAIDDLLEMFRRLRNPLGALLEAAAGNNAMKAPPQPTTPEGIAFLKAQAEAQAAQVLGKKAKQIPGGAGATGQRILAAPPPQIPPGMGAPPLQ